MDSEGYNRAIEILHKVLTPAGFIASLTDLDNYKRVWTRDAVITGLAVMMTDDEELHSGFKRTLDTIAEHQGVHGEIPSNVSGDDVSFGGLVGRVDPPLCYIIGVCAYVKRTGDRAFAEKHRKAMERALFMAACWEFNNRGFIYAPVSSDWADEYIIHGYTLLVEILYYHALNSFGMLFQKSSYIEKALNLKELIEINFRSGSESDGKLYHPSAYKRMQADPKPYWLASFNPTGYNYRFDGLANALILLSGIGSSDNADKLISFVESCSAESGFRLIYGFYPPIKPEDPEWEELRNNYRYRFSNYPWSYHNGGFWPMITGFWTAGLTRCNKLKLAFEYAAAIERANRLDGEGREWGFYEWHDGRTGKPGGMRYTAWSAAGLVMAWKVLESGKPPF